MKRPKDTDKIKRLRSERQRLLTALARIDKELQDEGISPIQYMDWKQQAMDFLDISAGYIQSAPVLQWVFKYDPEKLTDPIRRRKYITALSVALNSLNKAGIVKKFRLPDIKGDFYGLPGWFGIDGSLKKEFYGNKLNQLYRNIELKVKAGKNR